MDTEKSKSPWLKGKSAVLALTFPVDIESFILADGRRYAESANVISHQAYEPQVAVPRIIAMLADLQLRSTFYVPGYTADKWPGMVEQIAAAGHEIAHHSYSHRMPVKMTEAEERLDFERGLLSLEKLGIKPRGHRAAAWGARWTTAGLVAEYGLTYESNMMDDDRPYVLQTTHGDLVELPPHWAADDFAQYAFMVDPQIGFNVESPKKAAEIWRLELEASRQFGCLMQLTCHPFLSGRAARLLALRAFIEYAISLGDVAILTCGEVADNAREDPTLPRRVHQPLVVDDQTYPNY